MLTCTSVMERNLLQTFSDKKNKVSPLDIFQQLNILSLLVIYIWSQKYLKVVAVWSHTYFNKSCNKNCYDKKIATNFRWHNISV